MRIAVLIVTRGDRSKFIEQAKRMLLRQTIKPDKILFVDFKPEDDRVDLTKRYRLGCEQLKDFDLIIFWEDDDWYCDNYIETISTYWTKCYKPDVIGNDLTFYYNIRNQKFAVVENYLLCAMMNTAIAGEAVDKIKWCDDHSIHADNCLWRENPHLLKEFISIGKLSCGIKHGVGICGGKAHNPRWDGFKEQDKDFSVLKSIIKNKSDINFYTNLFKS